MNVAKEVKSESRSPQPEVQGIITALHMDSYQQASSSIIVAGKSVPNFCKKEHSQ